MTAEAVRKAVEATRHWRHRFSIHLTGGEPFLKFDLLCAAATIVAEAGISQFVETNAGWCTDSAKTKEWFQEIKRRGVEAVLISCSPFQAEHIPLRSALIAIQQALDVFGERAVTVYQAHCLRQVAAFSVNETVPLDAYVERYGVEGAGRIFWDEYALIGSGRSSYALGHLTSKYPPESFRADTCARELLYPHHSHFDLYGNHISWFCGGLRVGEWRTLENTLRDFEAQRFPPLIDVLVKNGPWGLLEMAEREHAYRRAAEGYTSKCHLCTDVRRHLASRGDFWELEPRQFYEML